MNTELGWAQRSNEEGPRPSGFQFRWNKWFTLAAVGVVLILIGIGILSYRVNQRNEGEAIQERVEQAYSSAQVSLSTCLDQGQIAAQVADNQWDRYKDILVEVVGARYQTPDGNDVSNAAEALGNGRAFSAVLESYPDLDAGVFERLQDVVVGCRDSYQGAQNRVLNEVREFETWIETGSLWSQGIRNNFPDEKLEVEDTASGVTLRGQAALDYIDRVIIVSDAKTAYETGEAPEQDLFGDD